MSDLNDYVSINPPVGYGGDTKIFLKDIISEIEGMRFSFVLMNQVLQTPWKGALREQL